MRFRLFIFKDPDASDRGFSLKGIKIPLTTFIPVPSSTTITTFHGDKIEYGRYTHYWKVPCCLLVLARPSIKSHVRGIDELYVPTEWVDVAPVDAYDRIRGGSW